MLKLDFYESGDGETILLTFPSGGIGIVDAHPSAAASRPEILELIRDRKVHFACLTHPHRDHGADLIPVLEQHEDLASFWHTVSDVDVSVFLQQEAMNYPNYPSGCRAAVERMKRGWAEFLIDLYGAVAKRDLPRHQLRNDQREVAIDGVGIEVLGPGEGIVQRFVKAQNERLKDFKKPLPDPNLLSAILVVRYGGVAVLLGGDALKENWREATRLHHERHLPKAVILKVPHHGASNALQVQCAQHEHNYLDICSHEPLAHSVLFAGDARHPDKGVFDRLTRRTNVICVSNGLKSPVPGRNPLNIALPGARAVALPPVCNPVVSFTISAEGAIECEAGRCEAACGA